MRWIEPGEPVHAPVHPMPPAGVVAMEEINWHHLPCGDLAISPRTGGWAVFDPAERTTLAGLSRVDGVDPLAPLARAAWQRALITVGGVSAYDEHAHAAAVEATRDYYTLVLLLNSGCNLVCSYCYLGHATPNNDRAMDMALARSAIEAALDRSWSTVLVDFGEIAVAERQFRTLLPWARSEATRRGKQLRAAVQTNGTTVDDDLADFLAANEVTVGISLDGPKDMHDDARRFRTGLGSYDKTVAAIRRCRDRNVRVHLIATVTRRAVGRAADVLGEINSHSPDSFLAKPVIAQGEAVTAWDAEGLGSGDFDEFMGELVTAVDRSGSDVLEQSAHKFLLRLLGDRGGWRDSCTSRYCGSGKSLHVVGADGGLHACPRFVFGDVKDLPLLQITRRPRHEDVELRDLLPSSLRRPPPTCEGCSWLASCGGGCTLAGQGANRSVPLPDPGCHGYMAIHETLFRTIIPSFLSGRHHGSRMFNGAELREVLI